MAATTTFTYTISDGEGNESTATVTVDITDVIPNANAVDDGPINITAGSTLTFPVLDNDSPTGVVLDTTQPIVTPPTKGTASVVGSQIRYVPTSGQLGPDSLVYRIRLPANNTTDTALFRIQINAAPRPGSNRSRLPWGTGFWSGGNNFNTAILNSWISYRNGRLIDWQYQFIGTDLYANWSTITSNSVIDSGGTLEGIYNSSPYFAVLSIPLGASSERIGQFMPYQRGSTGLWDTHYQKVANKIHAAVGSKKIYLRIGWEVTRAYEWSLEQNINQNMVHNPHSANYIACFRRIAGILANAIPGARIVWNCLKEAHTFQHGDFYPGDAFVDVIGCDPYDQDGQLSTAAKWAGGNAYNAATGLIRGPEGFALFARDRNKPLAFEEWGTSNRTLSASNPANNSFYNARMQQLFRNFADVMELEGYFHAKNGDRHSILPGASNDHNAQARVGFTTGWNLTRAAYP